MTIIKQKAVTSERHGENVRRYLNGKDALERDGWNIYYSDHWYAEMDRTRETFGHNVASRSGAKNTIMYHQILAFLPEECSINGGKMTPKLCMRFAMEYVAKRYPNQQVVFALHEESDAQGKRYAVHMAINRSDLMTGKRLWEGTGKKGHHDRVATVREMDYEWGLKQVEEGKPNSLIRNRGPRDAEKAIIEDDRYSYKSNLREIVASVIKSPKVRSLDDFKRWIEEFGGEVPSDLQQMQRLPGVGRKTANVLGAVLWQKEVMPVDTHVFRVSNRIGLTTNSKTPLQTELTLEKNIPPHLLPVAHHWLILHGRYVCTARAPKCGECGIAVWCRKYAADHKAPKD